MYTETLYACLLSFFAAPLLFVLFFSFSSFFLGGGGGGCLASLCSRGGGGGGGGRSLALLQPVVLRQESRSLFVCSWCAAGVLCSLYGLGTPRFVFDVSGQ